MAAPAILEEEEEIKDTGANSTAAATLEEDAGDACIDTSAVWSHKFAAVNDGAAEIPSTASSPAVVKEDEDEWIDSVSLTTPSFEWALTFLCCSFLS